MSFVARNHPQQTRHGADDPLVAHYANKADILAATIEGVAIEALCGKVWVPSHNPDGLPVCPQCEIELERIKNIDRAQRRLN